MFCKTRRLALAGLLLGPWLGLTAAGAEAQTYPARPVRLVVGFAPGGGTDILARLLAQKLADDLGQPFIVDNRAGATGMIAAKLVATAPADGYTLLMGHVNSQAIAPALMENPQYDPVKDFAPVAYLGFVPNVLVVPAGLPVRSVAELLARAKARPEGLSYASPGVGSTNHLAGELLRLDSGAKLIHVPYRGSGPATIDLLAGQVDMNFDAMPSALANIRAGLLRPLAVTTPQRDPELPDVPTMAELGFKTFDITNWYGLVAPAGTSPATVAALHAAVQRVLRMPDVARRMAEWGVRGEPMSTAQFGSFISAESAKYRDIAHRTGVRLER
jgi:tripartite-type tricarboxylate transporter receptor subunit TctC